MASHSHTKAFPDVISQPFESVQWDLAIDTVIGAWNVLKVKQNFQTWKGHNSGSKASPDVIPQPFESARRDLAIDAIIEAWNGLKVEQNS